MNSDNEELDVAPFQVFTWCMESPDGQQVAGRKVNTACTFNLGPDCTNINLQMLAQMFPELGGKCVIERMAAVFFRLSKNMACLRNKIVGMGLEGGKAGELGRDQTQAIYRRALVLLYAPGNAVITGMADETMSRCMAHEFCRMLSERAGIPAVMTDFAMTNIVINFQMQYGVSLDLLSTTSALAPRIDYTPNKFPMAVVHSASCFDCTLSQHDSSTTGLVTWGGCVNVTGIKSFADGVRFMQEIFPELWKYQIDESGGLLHMNAPPVRPLLPSGSSSTAASIAALMSASASAASSASAMLGWMDKDDDDDPDDDSEEVMGFLELDDCLPPETSFSQLTNLLVRGTLNSGRP